MPRPRTISDGAVLDATLALISRLGPSQVTFARVGQEVGLAPATLVQRFGTRRGMLLAAAEHGAPGREEVWARAREGNESALAALVEVLCRFASYVDTREAMANSLAFLHLDLSDPDFHRVALAGLREMREQIRALLDRAVAGAELRPCDTGALARAVQNAYNGALITWAISGEGGVRDWLRRELEFILEPFLP